MAYAAENTDRCYKDKHVSSSIVSDLGLSTIPNETGNTKHGWQNKGELEEMTLLTNW
jgi:hypothetical protein